MGIVGLDDGGRRLVAPAEAGAHNRKPWGIRGGSMDIRRWVWIPAFAGMTAMGTFALRARDGPSGLLSMLRTVGCV
jgi:hypothetical protein